MAYGFSATIAATWENGQQHFCLGKEAKKSRKGKRSSGLPWGEIAKCFALIVFVVAAYLWLRQQEWWHAIVGRFTSE